MKTDFCEKVELPVPGVEVEPGILWKRWYDRQVEEVPAAQRREVGVSVCRGERAVLTRKLVVLPAGHGLAWATARYLERVVKFLLWQVGGNRVVIEGADEVAAELKKIYAKGGAREFDAELMGKIFDTWIGVEAGRVAGVENAAGGGAVDGGLEGCRIGFDLGGSDRKVAAVVDGKVVFSEEIRWDPYFQKDPSYHYEGVMASLKAAAAQMPRVDAIGGSAAGVYVNNEVRVASLFRGVSPDVFEKEVRGMFLKIAKEWGEVPFVLANDGEVAALAGAMELGRGRILGVSLGTSMAGGYATAAKGITEWLNELAFAPVDFAVEAPVDEWSGDAGCGVSYFSQQGVNWLAGKAGFNFGKDVALAERLVMLQELVAKGDERAERVFESVGVCLGWAVAWYAEFYDVGDLMLMGRVMSGRGGELVMQTAERVLREELPEIAKKVRLCAPGEVGKRHGQAIAAASLPRLRK